MTDVRVARSDRRSGELTRSWRTGWRCLNCGTVWFQKHCPFSCEVCSHRRGYQPNWRHVKTRLPEGAPPGDQTPKGKRGPRTTSSRRVQVYMRDRYTCVECGHRDETGKTLTLDHIRPRSKGGSNDVENLQTMCGPCNNVKGDTWPWTSSNGDTVAQAATAQRSSLDPAAETKASA